MLRNYFKIALRNLMRHKGYAFINIAGLAVGLACCLLIGLFVRSELSYDRFHEKADRLYRAWVDEREEGERFFNTITPIPLGPTLERTFPDVQEAVRLYAYADLVRRGERQFTERIHLADSAFFDVFTFPLIRGDPQAALDQPNSVVLTEPIARKYFGDEDPVGQTLAVRVGGEVQDLTVTGVAEAPPEASSIQFDVLVPFAKNGFRESSKQAWRQIYVETYVLLREGTSADALEAKLPSMVQQVFGDQYREGTYLVGLQNITNIHLNPDIPIGLEPISDPAYSYILSAIALLVLLIACINFVTLSVGRSADRALEVGVRKAVGAQRRQLVGQFWGEALLLTGLALMLGIVLTWVFLPLFNSLSGRTLYFTFGLPTVLMLLGALAVVGLAAGSYPAIVLSGFRPVEVLKGTLQVKGDKSFLRRGLVVVQFALAIFLVASMLVMAQQMRYLQTKNLGFDKEQVVTIPTTGGFSEGFRTYELLRGELQAVPGVAGVTASAFVFGGPGWAGIGYHAEDGTYREFNANFAGYDFVETLGIEMAAGRPFSRELSADTSRGLLVNEAFVAEYGWEDPIGRRLPGPFPDHEVIGVVEDFNYASLHTPVEPLVIAANPDLVLRGAANVDFSGDPTPDISVRLRPENLPATLEQVERAWKAVAPEQPFAYTFLDAAVDSQYRLEARLSRIVGVASALAILIACLGLFGLAALTAVRRTKEIGVRKVLGASVSSITLLLSKDFLGLVLVALALAVPVAYLVMRQWLEGFAYRVGLGPSIFVLAGVLVLLIALVTVSYQAVKAALADPVKSLRYE